MVSGLYKDLERRKVRIRINLGKDFELYSMNSDKILKLILWKNWTNRRISAICRFSLIYENDIYRVAKDAHLFDTSFLYTWGATILINENLLS